MLGFAVRELALQQRLNLSESPKRDTEIVAFVGGATSYRRKYSSRCAILGASRRGLKAISQKTLRGSRRWGAGELESQKNEGWGTAAPSQRKADSGKRRWGVLRGLQGCSPGATMSESSTMPRWALGALGEEAGAGERLELGSAGNVAAFWFVRGERRKLILFAGCLFRSLDGPSKIGSR